MPWKPLKGSRFVGRTATGRVYEQLIELTDPETGETKELRRHHCEVEVADGDGDKEIHLLTNLPSRARRQRRSLNCIASVGPWSKRLMS